MARYEFIDAEKATTGSDGARRYSIKQMCQWLEVSVSGYYEWLDRPASATAQWRDRLKPVIVKAFTDSDSRYGYRRVHAQLARWGIRCHPEVVRDLMRELDLVPCQPRRFPQGHHQAGGQARRHPRPDQPGLHRHRPRTEAGRGHHLHPHLGRLGLPRPGHRLLLPQDRGLGDGRQLQDPTHPGVSSQG